MAQYAGHPRRAAKTHCDVIVDLRIKSADLIGHDNFLLCIATTRWFFRPIRVTNTHPLSARENRLACETADLHHLARRNSQGEVSISLTTQSRTAKIVIAECSEAWYSQAPYEMETRGIESSCLWLDHYDSKASIQQF